MNQNYNEAGAQAPAKNKEEQANRGIHQTAFWRKQNRNHSTISWARY